MSRLLFALRSDGAYDSKIPRVRGLAEALEALVHPEVSLPEFGPTHADASQEEFWRLMVRSGQEAELTEARRQLTHMVRATVLSAEELSALTRLCNATRLAEGFAHDTMAYELLTAMVSEASEAMLAAECGR